MNAALRNFLLAMLPVAGLTPGCLHHHAVSPEASGMLACEAGPTESSCFESSRFDPRGMLRHHIVERTIPGDRCDLVVVEQASFDDSGVLIERVVEDRRCRVVDQRVTTRYDLETGLVEHRVERDHDHDDRIDHDRTTRVAMSSRVRDQALVSGRARTIHLIASIAAQRGGPAGARESTIATRGLR
jgi:hypothetical protein